jgi:hypothetical protein
MKRGIILLLICTVYFSCKKDKVKLFQTEGVITGINVRQCLCVAECPCACGGLFFHFIDTVYTANIPLDNPQIFNFPSNIKFPVFVKINWENTTRCGTTAIRIIDYKIL